MRPKIKKNLKEIKESRCPLIVLGRRAVEPSFQKPLKGFIKKSKIPFVSTQMGKGAYDENSPLNIGTTALSIGEYVHEAIDKADLLIVIGDDNKEKPPFLDKSDGKIIKIDNVSEITEIQKKIKLSSKWDFGYYFEVRGNFLRDLNKFSKSLDFPLRPERVVSDIQEILPKNGRVALDNGMFKLYFARQFTANFPKQILLDNTLATMGAGLPSAMTLKMLYPNQKIIAVVGDGGIMMSIGDLETAVRLRLDLVVLILNDNAFGMIEWKQRNMGLKNFGLTLNNPDFVKLAESFGAKGYNVAKASDLSRLLRKTINLKGTHVINCPISYQEANKTLTIK